MTRLGLIGSASAALAAGIVFAAPAAAAAPPVGPLPAAVVTSVQTRPGSLVSIALPRRAGYSWRIARAFDSKVARQVTEGDIGPVVVLVFKAVGKGRTNVIVAQTRGETAKAYRAVKYVVRVI